MSTKKAKLSATEEIHRMREETKQKDKEIAELKRKLEREYERAAAASAAVKLIPRPKGQAGRDYTLQQEMMLGGDSERYNRLYHVHQLLPVSKTIRAQDKRRLEKAIVAISEVVSYFKKFEGLWPIHDMIAGYLLNMQTRRRRDLAAEKKASGLDLDESAEEGDEDGVETETPEVRHLKRRKNPVVVESDDSDEEMPEVKPKTIPKKKKLAGNKRKAEDLPAEEPSPKKKKSTKKAKADTILTAEPSSKSNTKTATASGPLIWSALPRKCPKAHCNDTLPKAVNPRILFLYSEHQDLLRKVGPAGQGIFFSETQICDAITQEKNRQQYEELGRKNSWPTAPDFEALPARVLAMRKDLVNMIRFPTILGETCAWNNFLSNIDNWLFTFSNSDCKMEYTFAVYGSRCGYFGAKGQTIIESSISRLFLGDEDTFSYALYSTLESLVSTDPDRFDDYDGESKLLELEDFIHFVLVPTVAMWLISEDFDVEFDIAEDTREASSDFGEIIQPDDEKTRANVQAMKHQPLRAHKAPKKNKVTQNAAEDITSYPKSPPRGLSLNDFPEPDPLAPKTKVKKEKKPAASKQNPKPNAIISNYATRAKSKVEAESK